MEVNAARLILRFHYPAEEFERVTWWQFWKWHCWRPMYRFRAFQTEHWAGAMTLTPDGFGYTCRVCGLSGKGRF